MSDQLGRESDPQRIARLHYELARVYEWPLGELEPAAKHYREAFARTAEHLPTVRGARRVLLAKKDYEAALPLMDAETRLVREPVHKAAIFYEKGRLLEDLLGRTREAREAYAAALALDERSPTYLLALEHANAALAEWDDLGETLGREAEVASDSRQQAALISERARLVETKKSDSRGATELYQVALRIDEPFPESLATLRRLHLAHSRYGELADVLRLEAQEAKDVQIRAASWYALGRVLEGRLGRVDEALEAFEKASTETPRDRIVLDELARLYERVERWRDLASVLERIAALTENDHERVVLWHRIGTLFSERVGDEDAAVTAYGRALKIDPGHAPSVDALSALLSQQTKWAEIVAMHAAEVSAVDEPARRAAIHERIATIFERRLGRPEDAATHHQKALGLLPGYPASFKALCRIYQSAGKHRELAELYERAVDGAPDKPTQAAYLSKIGAIFEDALRDPATAVAVYHRLLDVIPGDLGAIHALERAAERAERWDDVIEALKLEAATLTDKTRMAPLCTRAGDVAFGSLGEVERAVRLYEKALEVDPRHAAALAALARLYLQKGRWEDLIDVHRRELELEPGAAGAKLCHRIGEIEEQHTGRKDRAIDWYRKALALDPLYPPSLRALERALEETQAWEELADLLARELQALTVPELRARAAFRLAEIYEHRLGQTEKALRAYDAALDAAPDLRAARDARLRLLYASDTKRLQEELGAEAAAAADPARAIAALLLRAELLRDELGDVKGAIASFEAVLAKNPLHIGALRALERLFRKLEDWPSLAQILTAEARAQKESAQRIACLRELARVEEKAGSPPEKIRQTYLQILELAPAEPLALSALERMALLTHDNQLLEMVDARLAAGAAPSALVGAHRTRLGEGYERGSSPRALETFRGALALELKDVGAAWGIVRLAEPSSDARLLAEAAELTGRILLEPARAARLLVRSAELLGGAGDGRGAANALARALELYPDDPDAPGRLHRVLTEQGEITRAVDVLTRAARAAESSERSAELWLLVAGLFSRHRNDVPAALATLRRAIEETPDHIGLRRELAGLLIADRQWRAAAEQLERLLALRPPSDVALMAHLERTDILSELGDIAGAERSVEAALAIRPKHVGALQRLVELQSASGRYEAAEETTERLLGASTTVEERADAYARMARLLKARGEIAEAADSYAEAVALTGLGARIAEEYTVLLSEVAKSGAKAPWEGYTAAINRRLSKVQDPVERTALLRELARVYADEMAAPDRAIAALDSALTLDPNDVALRLELAARLLRGHQHAQAEEHLRKLVEIDALRAEVWRYLVETYRTLHRPADALLATAPLVALGFASEAEKTALAMHSPRPALGVPGALDAALLASLEPGVDRDFPSELLAALPECLSKLYPPDLERWGLSVRDRITTRTGHPLRVLADRVAAVFGVGDFDLYLHRVHSNEIAIELGDLPAILVPAHLAGGSESAQIFLLARPMANIARKIHALHRLAPIEIEIALAAAIRTVVPSFGSTRADGNYIETLSRQLTRVISRRERRAVEELAPAYAAAPPADFGVWRKRVMLTATRAALILSDDLPSAVAFVRRAESAVDATALLQELLRFWVSDLAKSLRRRVVGA